MNIYRLLAYLKNNLDLLLAWAGLGLSLGLIPILIILETAQPISLAITVTLTCGLYILTRRKLSDLSVSKTPTYIVKVNAKWISVVVVLLLEMIIGLVLFYSVDSLVRPLWIFLALSFLPILIMVQCLMDPKTITDTVILIQLCLWVTGVILSSITVFPYNGSDTWVHLDSASSIIESKSVSHLAGVYHDYPLYPSLIGSLSLISKWSEANMARVLNVLVGLIIVLLFYSLISGLGIKRVEKFIILFLLVGSSWFIYWSIFVVSMSVATVFYVAIVVLIISKIYRRSEMGISISLILILIVLPFFHPLIAFATAIFSWLIGVTQVKTSRVFLMTTVPVLATTILLTHWIYYGTFFDKTLGWLVYSFSYDTTSLGVAVSFRSSIDYALDNYNYFLLLGLAGIAFLNQIKYRSNHFLLTTSMVGFTLIGFGFLTQIINLQNVLPHRWYYFGLMTLIFPAGKPFVYLMSSRKPVLLLISFILFYSYIVMGIINTQNNRDRPFYGELATLKHELSYSEFAGVRFIEELMNNRPDQIVMVDFKLWDYLRLKFPDSKKLWYWYEIEQWDDILFSMRSSYYNRFILKTIPDIRLDDPCPALSQIYDSGDFAWIESLALDRCK